MENRNENQINCFRNSAELSFDTWAVDVGAFHFGGAAISHWQPERHFEKEAAEKALGSLLNEQLPLKLDAKTAYRTVNTLPGGPFQPRALQLTAADMDTRLAPGVGKLADIEGKVQICDPKNVCKTVAPGDTVNMGDTITRAAGSRAYILFADNTAITLGENTKLKVDEYVYDPNHLANDRASYSILQGAFRFVSGLLIKRDDNNVRMDTAYGGLGIHGTQFIMRANGAEIDLIKGAVAAGANPAAPHAQFTGPVKIMRNATDEQGSPLTQAEYNAIQQQLFPGQGPAAVIHK